MTPWTITNQAPLSMKFSKQAFWRGLPFPTQGDILNPGIVFPGGSVSKSLAAMQETLVQFLGQEDPLEKDMITHSSILVWRLPWTEEPDGLQFIGFQRVGHDWVTNDFAFTPEDLPNSGIKPRSPPNPSTPCRQVLYCLNHQGKFIELKPLTIGGC